MSIAESIKFVLEAKAAALVEQSPVVLEAIIDPSFLYVNARGSKFSKEEYIAAYCRSGTIRILTQKLSDIEVIDFGSFAVASMTVTDKVAQAGVESAGRYRSLCVFRKAGLAWLWAAAQTSAV